MYSRRQFLAQGATLSLALATASECPSAPAPRKPKFEADPKLFTPEVRKTVDRALAFLAHHQNADGSFGTCGYQGNVGITGLAALAFVTAGHRPDATARGKVVGKALDFILSQENVAGGHPGFLHNPKASPHGPMYNHGFATLLLACVHGTIKDKKQAARVEETLGRAVKLIVESQNREGGWRYTPDSRDADITVTTCQMASLLAARKAGIEVPDRTIDQGIAYVKKCQDRDSGAFRYMTIGAPSLFAFARTAAGVLVLQRAGLDKKDEVKKGLAYLVKNRPGAKIGRPEMHYFFGHYYAAAAMHHAGGEPWKEWYTAIRKELLERQGPDGSWQDQIDQHYATALACIVLLAPNGRLAAQFGPKKKK